MQSPLLAQLLPSAHIGQYAPDDGDVPSQWLADVPQYPNGLQHCPPLHTASLAEFQPHSKLGAVATGLFGAPQSTSVSSPFCTPSLQVGDEQMFCRQTPDAQSEATAHPMPCSHDEQGPPQSVPVSAPLWMPSQQVAARHVNMVGCVAGGRAEPIKASRVRQGNGGRQRTLRTEQEPCSQSEPLEQDFPTAQASHAGPPQSTSVSASLCTASSHDACTTGSAAKMHAHATSNATGRSKGRFIFRGCLLSSQVACFLLCRLPCSLNTAAAPKHQSINARIVLPLSRDQHAGVRP